VEAVDENKNEETPLSMPDVPKLRKNVLIK
jgi:hypothetical protein